MAQPEHNLPSFNRSDKDQMALGHTPSTRSAELVAGARAVLMNTPETIALSKMSGRIVSRFLSDIDRSLNVMWFFPARIMAIEALTKRLFPDDQPDRLFVDVAAGFSPRGLHLAQQYPQAQVIEVDLPEVIVEKKKRLEKGRITIPINLHWIAADLGKDNLSEVLNGRKADMITAEGLTLYLTPTENARLFRQISSCLKPEGAMMVEVYFKDKLQHLRQNANVNSVASFVIRIVGNIPGLVPNMETVRKLMTEAGLGEIVDYPVTNLMDELGQPKPLDVISIVMAHKPAISEWIGIAPVAEVPIRDGEDTRPLEVIPVIAATDEPKPSVVPVKPPPATDSNSAVAGD